MRDPRFDGIPLVLETIDPSLWPEEIAWLYSLQNASSKAQKKAPSKPHKTTKSDGELF